jgi:hypothetical protein
MATKKNANSKNEVTRAKAAAGVLAASVPVDVLEAAAENTLEAKFERNAPNGELSEQEKYFQVNTSNTREVAYAVNNNQLSVDDLPANFPAELLSPNKQKEFAARAETPTE